VAWKRDVTNLAGEVIAVVETDLAVVDGLQTAVGDGDAEYVAAEIVEDLFTAPRMLTVNDPGFFPEGWINVADQACLFQSRTEFRTEDHRQSPDGNKEVGVFGIDPGGAIGGKTASRNEHMNVGMEEHGARPGVEDGERGDASAEVARIAGKFLQGIRGGFDQQAVDFPRMGSSQLAQLRRQSEGHQEVGTGQEVAALFLDPALGLILVTLRTGTIPAGVIRENFLLAAIALMDVASQERRAAGGNIP